MAGERVRLVVDGRDIEVPRGYTLMQACEEAGAEIPRFCYHERLSIAGNCRMCLVDWEGAPKPVASCAMSVGDLRPNRDGSPPRISTRSERAMRARAGVMEFLLINHPLDCPICDQGGECDLQDQAMAYGRRASRYFEGKRAVDDKYMGPLVKTVMTRCIQCTRCVRFAAEVAGVEEIGLVGRGENAEITTYLERALTSELSGNVIDLCPVGALTSRPYAFHARPWELRSTDTIDVMDALGSHIRMDTRGGSVMRILPRLCDDINGEWISDKTRFVWDGLARQRLDTPYLRRDGRLRPAGWDEALDAVAARLTRTEPGRIGAIAGDLACVESMKALLDLLESLGVASRDCRQDGAAIGQGPGGELWPRQSRLLNAGIAGVDAADMLLLVGTDPRIEAPVLNARIRHGWLRRGLEVGLIGERTDLTYPYAHLGESPAAIGNMRDRDFERGLRRARRPMVLLGQGAVARADGAVVLRLASTLAAALDCEQDWQPFNMLHTAAARVGGLDIGFLPGADGLDTTGIVAAAGTGEIETLILLGADEIDMRALGDAFVVYIGSHGDAGANRADIVLPAAAYSEKRATYVNTEGLVQRTRLAATLKGAARADWAILRALSERAGHTLPYDDEDELRRAMASASPVFAAGGQPREAALRQPFGVEGQAGEEALRSPITRFHLTNPIARSSKTMGECAQLQAVPVRAAAE